jgi:hypothetical protein
MDAPQFQQFHGMELCVLYGNQLVMWPEKSFFDDVVQTRT